MRFRYRLAALWSSWQPGPALVTVPVALMAVIAAADILSPPDIHLGPLLVVAPALTASFAGPGPRRSLGLRGHPPRGAAPAAHPARAAADRLAPSRRRGGVAHRE
ncbi:hypothetical protein GCM10009753_28740 [Streptantibioticus ferralitis]